MMNKNNFLEDVLNSEAFKKSYFKYKDILNKNNQVDEQFEYFIDDISCQKEGEIYIRGWGFSKADKKSLNYGFLKEDIEQWQLKRFLREDVNAVYEIDANELLGFEITALSKNKKDTYLLLKNKSNAIVFSAPLLLEKRLEIDKEAFLHRVENQGLRGAIKQINLENYLLNCKEDEGYGRWIFKHEGHSKRAIRQEIKAFKKKVKFSIVVPVYNVEEKWLCRCIDSLLEQYYTYWELCIADDCSTSPHVKRILDAYVKKDSRIKVVYREKNGHISEATNSAIALATGDFVGFMDNDDELLPISLFEYAKVINENEDAEFMYCDEDKLKLPGTRVDPFFKPDWNPELILGHNYITHFVVVKRTVLSEIGLLKTEMNGSQDYDFVLRATEKAKGIYHIPKILYHWRSIEGSVALNPEAKNYAYFAGKKALEEALKRRGIKGSVSIAENYGNYRISYDHEEKPLVSIIIAHKEGNSPKAVETVLKNTEYPNYEIIVVGPVLFTGVDDKRVKIHADDSLKTKSAALNKGIEKAEGGYFVFLDSKTEVLKTSWLDEFLNLGMKKETGIVGGKVFEKEDRLRSAGISIKRKDEVFYPHKGETQADIGYYYRLILPQNVFAVSEELMLIERNLCEKIGGFNADLDYPLSSLDLCIKARKRMRNIVFNPEVVSVLSDAFEKEIRETQWDTFNALWSWNFQEDRFTNKHLIELIEGR